MKICVLTGNIATGKSSVSRLLREKHGIPIVDADKIAHEITNPGTKTFDKIVKTFGEAILEPVEGSSDEKRINRKALGEIVFNNPEELKKLNRLTHGAVVNQIIWDIATHFFKGERVIVLDIPLYFETRREDKLFDLSRVVSRVMCMEVTAETQKKRLLSRNPELTEEDAQARMDKMIPIDEKCKMADVVINNEGSMEDLEREVDKMWVNMLKELAREGFGIQPKHVYVIGVLFVLLLLALIWFLFQ